MPFEWLDIERDGEARRLLAEPKVEARRNYRLIRFPDGTVVVQPSDAQIAEKIGLKIRPDSAFSTS